MKIGFGKDSISKTDEERLSEMGWLNIKNGITFVTMLKRNKILNSSDDSEFKQLVKINTNGLRMQYQ